MAFSSDEVIQALSDQKSFLWINEEKRGVKEAQRQFTLSQKEIEDAAERLYRFAPVLEMLFPELKETGGIIESDLLPLHQLKNRLDLEYPNPLTGRLWMKADHALPVAGSIKARGGIYAVLKIAEEIATAHRILNGPSDDYQRLLSPEAKKIFQSKILTVASTGNLGLSIGIMGKALGFNVHVHMSSEAREWKKKRLRNIGVRVIEYDDDYTAAGHYARDEARDSHDIHFIDDENSLTLFLGYSVAAIRLKNQLAHLGLPVNRENPLFLYLPCGVGGAPGGITFGARLLLGDHVHCFFAEPAQAPCMLLGMATQKHADISVYDIGLQLKTHADGLAVSRPSQFIGKLMQPLLSGIYTVSDARLYQDLLKLFDEENIEVEPSAAAGINGPYMLLNTEEGQSYLKDNDLKQHLSKATHLIWTTGGTFVPLKQHKKYRNIAEQYIV